MGKYVGILSKSRVFREYILKEVKKMIFVTLGSQKFQFDRLLKYIDDLINEEVIDEEVFAQVGYSSYLPKNFEYENFLTREEFIENMEKANIVITHSGTGAIVTAIKNDKKVIAVPRQVKYKEHVDDHQIQIAENFVENKFILCALDKASLIEAYNSTENFQFRKFISNNSKYISIISEFLS